MERTAERCNRSAGCAAWMPIMADTVYNCPKIWISEVCTIDSSSNDSKSPLNWLGMENSLKLLGQLTSK
uniref:Uncharacterized protein n=1 Tax=Heterorhabditis bacteriophora TaxID=37862 RepID=A0A1I7WNK1_HETBA